MLPAIDRIDPAQRMTLTLRGGITPPGAGVAPPPGAGVAPPQGSSINAAGLKIPGMGEGAKLYVDEYLPSFPDPSLFPDVVPLGDTAAAPWWEPPAAAAAEEDEAVEEPEEDEEEDDRVAEERELEAEEETEELSDEDRRVIAELQTRDREVRAHEQAHISAGGPYIRGGASYEFERGPDDKRYAVGGEVSIDSSPIRDNPEATIAKMQVVRAAALAPADPSAQDRAVAAAASRQEASASIELREQRAAEAQEAGARNDRQLSYAISAYTRSDVSRVLLGVA